MLGLVHTTLGVYYYISSFKSTQIYIYQRKGFLPVLCVYNMRTYTRVHECGGEPTLGVVPNAAASSLLFEGGSFTGQGLVNQAGLVG